MRDPDISVRVSAIHALAAIGGERVSLALGMMAQDENPLVRLAVAESMRKNWHPALFEFIVGMVNDNSFEVRIAATETLGRSGDSNALKPLIVCLNDPDEDVRRAATQALGNLKDTGALYSLIGKLLDPEAAVRQAAESALKLIDREWFRSKEALRALPLLQQAASSTDYRVQHSAAKHAKLISGHGNAKSA